MGYTPRARSVVLSDAHSIPAVNEFPAGQSEGLAPRDAIQLRGVVKRFGAITAVDGWTSTCRRASASACSGRRGPASRLPCGAHRAGDRGRRELRVLGHELPGERRSCRDGCRPAARQPRRGRHGGGQPGGVRPALPGSPMSTRRSSGGLEFARLTGRGGRTPAGSCPDAGRCRCRTPRRRGRAARREYGVLPRIGMQQRVDCRHGKNDTQRGPPARGPGEGTLKEKKGLLRKHFR